MGTLKQSFFDDFNQAFDAFIIEHGGTTMPPDVCEIKRFISDCPNKEVIERFIQIKFPECPLEIYLLQISAGPNYLHGSWIVVSNGKRVIAFHFPINRRVNVILNVYFNGDSDLLKYLPFRGAVPAAQGYNCINAFFNNPYRKNLFRRPPICKENYLEALKIIWDCSFDIFCKDLKTK
jgi:hypothetical protein